MIGVQGEFDFERAQPIEAAHTPTQAEAFNPETRPLNRRLAVITFSSLTLGVLTTLLLARLHASPAPLEPAQADLPRPEFPSVPRLAQQTFIAPQPSSSPQIATPPPSSALAKASPEPLSMPLGSPNSRWQIAPGALTAEIPAAQMGAPESDTLMVDTPTGSAAGAQPDAVVHARRHNAHGLTLAAGSVIGCALETAIDSSRPGFVTCVVTDDVVSDDARTLLIERGTHVLGEYRSDARLGDERIGIIWNRLRKNDGTTVDLASAATDQQGRSGISGAVDNHWFTRIGAAVLLSVIEDGIAAASAPKANGTTLVFGNTAAAGSTLSQKVLDASINIAPTITVSAGARVSILVAKDIDFQGAYASR